MKKVTACLTAVALASTVVASAAAMTGCSSADLRILLLANNTEDAFYKEYFEELEQEKGIKIKYNGYEKGSYYDKLSVEINQGKVPDIFYLRPNEIMQFRDDLQSVDDYVAAQKAEATPTVNFDDVIPAALNMYKYNETTKKMDEENGKLYAFPKDLSTQQFGYNKKILNKFASWFATKNLPLPWEFGNTAKGFGNKFAYTWEEYNKICSHISNTEVEGTTYVACDVPDIEIIAKSYGGDLLDLSQDKVTITSDAVKAAVTYQATLCTPTGVANAGANKSNAAYKNFTTGTVAFYSQCGTWEVGDYNNAFNDADGTEQWGLMPTPVKEGNGENWKGMITSAGYVVSKYSKKADLAKEVAASFLTSRMQTRMMGKGLMLPLLNTLKDRYLSSENDKSAENPNGYAPSTRKVFYDVISGAHGFVSVSYKTYDSTWLDIFSTQLNNMHISKISGENIDSLTYLNNPDKFKWNEIQSNMQAAYDLIKNK